jgi:hypothetical protein
LPGYHQIHLAVLIALGGSGAFSGQAGGAGIGLMMARETMAEVSEASEARIWPAEANSQPGAVLLWRGIRQALFFEDEFQRWPRVSGVFRPPQSATFPHSAQSVS